MTVRTAERRTSYRMPAAYTAVMLNGKGHVIAHGRTANISENGVMIVASCRFESLQVKKINVELTLPGLSRCAARRMENRIVRYRCRIVRIESIGQMYGVAVEFLKKLQ